MTPVPAGAMVKQAAFGATATPSGGGGGGGTDAVVVRAAENGVAFSRPEHAPSPGASSSSTSSSTPVAAAAAAARPGVAPEEGDSTTYDTLLNFLEGRGNVTFKHLVHGPTLTSAESVAVRVAGGWSDTTLASGAKAMVLKGKKGFALLVLAADRKVDWKKVKKAVTKDLRLATEQEVLETTKCLPGAVPPFGSKFISPMPTYVDESLKNQGPTINFNCGLRTRSVKLIFADYLALENPTICDFTSES